MRTSGLGRLHERLGTVCHCCHDRRIGGQVRQTATAAMRLDEGKAMSSSTARRATRRFGFERRESRSNFVAARLDETENHAQQPGNLGNVGVSEQSKREELRSPGWAY
jgi:hypothetical protein